MPKLQVITPCLWFDSQAEEAATFYVGIFENSKITAISRYTEAGKEATFQLIQCAFNGGDLPEAVSAVLNFAKQYPAAAAGSVSSKRTPPHRQPPVRQASTMAGSLPDRARGGASRPSEGAAGVR